MSDPTLLDEVTQAGERQHKPNIYADIQARFPSTPDNERSVPERMAASINDVIMTNFPDTERVPIVDKYLLFPVFGQERDLFGKHIMDYLKPLTPNTHLGVQFTPQVLRNYAEMMRLEHKIHLMPKPEYKVMAAERILTAVKEDPELREALCTGKILLRNPVSDTDEQPQVVLYPQLGQEAALKVLEKIEILFGDCVDVIGMGVTPRGNEPVDGKLVYYAQGSWDIKAAYMDKVEELRRSGSSEKVPELDDDLIHFNDESERSPSVVELYKTDGKAPTLDEELHAMLAKSNNLAEQARPSEELTIETDRIRPVFAEIWEKRKDSTAQPVLLPGVMSHDNLPVYGIMQEVNGKYIIGLVKNNEKPLGTIILGVSGTTLMTFEASMINTNGLNNSVVAEIMDEVTYDSFSIFNLPFSNQPDEDIEVQLPKRLGTALIDMTMMAAQELNVPRVELVNMMEEQRDWIKTSGYAVIEDIMTDSGTNLTLLPHSKDLT